MRTRQPIIYESYDEDEFNRMMKSMAPIVKTM